MTDLEALLSNAARADSTQPTPESVVDADIARGRRALTGKRLRQGGTRGLLLAALAAGAFAVVQPQDDNTNGPPTTAATATAAKSVASPSIQLVAYTGAQPEGFTVGTVPDGWEIQGVSNYALVIARKGHPDRSIDVFVGKLVVILQSNDEPDRTDGTKVAVGSGTGFIVRDGGTVPNGNEYAGEVAAARLFFGDSAGHRLLVQVPAALGWSDARIAEFGASVTANDNAEPAAG